MAIIKNCPIYYVRCDPKHPNASYSKTNPTWEVQLRTSDPAQKEEWIAANLNVRLMKYKDDAKDADGEDIGGMPILDDNGKRQWRVNLKKRSKAKDGSPAAPVKVVAGSLEDMNPNTVGNGSIANVRVFQYTFPDKVDGTTKTASILMAIQLRKHVVYVPKSHDDMFEEEGMDTVDPDEGTDSEPAEATSLTPNRAPAAPSITPVDQKPAAAF